MKKLLLTSLVLVSTQVLAEQSQVDAIEQAAMQLNNKQLVELTQTQESYDQALAYYRLAIGQNISADSDGALASANQAMEILENYLEQDPQDGEAWALLAQVYGLKIAYQPMKGAYYGPKSGSALAKAFEHAPTSPRTYLVQGISAYNTPVMFGGSKPAALKAFDKAIELYANDSADNQWGHAEVYIWRGLTQLSQNNADQAINDWQQALSIAPNYGWAKMLIAQNQ